MIHAAAVSDYKLKKPFSQKLTSRLSRLTLELVPTKKIIQFIKKINPKIFLVGFKLEPKINPATVKSFAGRLIQEASCDLVVVNNTTGNSYHGYIVDRGKNILAHELSRRGISRALLKTLKDKL